MSAVNIDVSTSATSRNQHGERPLIIAVYRHDDPHRKRRVKVPVNIEWRDFISLINSRLDIQPDHEIELYDEKGIEIVSVDDLVENDVLVVREKTRKASKSSGLSRSGSGYEQTLRYPERNVVTSHMMPGSKSHGSSDHTSSLMVGTPQLSHFIQSNSFGYYFLAEVENLKLLPTHSKIRKTHCIVKVPHCTKVTGTQQTFESEASLLRKISTHRCIISAPGVQILNFSESNLQVFFSSVPHSKQVLLRELFMSGGCMEAYIYPLYGVTMATKIKTGLMPDKVLKYAYQMADIMYYLQQRGVIHQNLLPENIQVMSNDRVVVCNFETAVQTDPTTCLLVISQSVVAPSNRKGLSPEVVSAFSRLRIETETVDYSTQYPWSFGALSVIMSTGQHPLKDYPDSFELGNRVKYRSHHYQALPDMEQYPPIFHKLVKRSLSCDPVRRPTLPQIISILKKDPKILAMMTSKRGGSMTKPRESSASSATAAERVWITSEPKQEAGGCLRPHSARTVKQSRGLFDARGGGGAPTILKRTSSDEVLSRDGPSFPLSSHYRGPMSDIQLSTSSRSPQQRSRYQESHDHLTRSHDQRVKSHDPFLPPDPKAQSYPGVGNTKEYPTGSPNKQWDTFTDDQRRYTSTFYPLAKSHDTPSQVDPRVESHTLKRYGSQGAFSDDFVAPRLSRESSNRSIPNLPQAVQRVSSASRLRMSSSEGLHSRATGGTSESDLSQVAEIQYQRLVASPNAQSSDERSPIMRRSDMGRRAQLLAAGASAASSGTSTARVTKSRDNAKEGNEYGDLTPDMPRSKVARSFSYRVAQRNGKMEFESPLSLRRCFSDEKASPSHEENMEATTSSSNRRREEDMLGDFGMEILQQISALGNDQSTSQLHSGTTGNHGNKNDTDTHDHHMVSAESASSSTGPDGILMSSGTAGKATTDTQTTGASLELTNQSPSGQANTNDQDGVEQMDTQSVRETSEGLSEVTSGGLLSPLFATNSSISQPLATNKEFWSNLLADFGSEEGNGQAEGGATNVDVSKPGFYLFSLNDSSLAKLDSKQNTTSQNSETGPLLSPISPQSPQDLDIFPQALSSESNLLQEEEESSSRCVNSMSQIPLLAGEDEELTPQEDEQQLLPKLDVQNGTNIDVTSWLREVSRVTNQTSISDHVSNHVTTSTPSSNVTSPPVNSQSVATALPSYAGNIRGYDIMSPIPEASQELTSSMSQSNTNKERVMATDNRLRSVSPISEVRSNSPSIRQTSVSPFRHSALSASDHTSTQRSQSTSEQGSTAQSSSVVTALHNASTTSDARPSITGQTSSESATNLSELRVVTPKPDAQSDVSTPPRDHVSVSSESCDVSQTSSARAQVNVDVTSAICTLMNSTSPDPKQDTQMISSPPQDQLQSSSESGEHIAHAQRHRSGTPQSSSSAPARIQQNSGLGRETRALSPLATSNLSASSALVTRQKPRSTSQGGGSRESGASRMRYSQQRVSEYPRHQPRINQDLEMMNLAISGMDSQERTRQISASHNRPQTTSSSQNRNQSTTQNRNQTIPSGSQNRNQTIPSGSQNRNQPNNDREQPNHRHNRPDTTDPSRSFRPITPVLTGGSNIRSSSAPSSREHEIQTSRTTANDQLSGTGPQVGRGNSSPQQSLRERPNTNSTEVPLPPQVSVDSYDYLPPYSPPRPQGVNDTHQPTGNQTQFSEPQSYPEPPPSYNEIFGGGSSQGRGGRRRRNRGSNLRRSQTSGERSIQSPDGSRPASQSSESRLFSSRNSSSQRRLPSLSRLFKRSRRHSHSGTAEHINNSSQQANETTPMDINEYTASWVESYSHTPRPADVLSTVSSTGGVSTAPSQASRALSDTTTTRSSPSTRRDQPPVPYRHPPPFQTETETIPQTSMSDVGRSYPPPRRHTSQLRGNLNASLSHIPTATGAAAGSRNIHTSSDLGTGHARVHVVRRGLSRDRTNDRPRPSSALITTETSRAVNTSYNRTSTRTTQGSSTHSTPGQGARLLINTGAMSSSCFNILSHDEDHEQSRPRSAAERRLEQTAIAAATGDNTPLGSTNTLPRRGRTVSTSRQANKSVSLEGPPPGGESRGSIPSPRGDENSSQNDPNLVANANANNINTNAVVSPRASCTTSPVIFNPTTEMTGSNSQVLTPPLSSNSITNMSTDATITPNITSLPTNTKSSTASTPTSGTTRTENLSSRAAARMRAETRRSQQDNRVSSSDEDNGGSSQRSDLSYGLSSGSSSRGRVRPRRRRSQQSSSGYSRANSIQGDASTRISSQSEAVRLVNPPVVQTTQLPQNGVQHSNDRQGTMMERSAELTETRVSNVPITEEQNSECVREGNERNDSSQRQTTSTQDMENQRETQSVTVEVTIDSGDSIQEQLLHVSVGKSCGHPCEVVSQSLCCHCAREQRTVAATEHSTPLQSCLLCQSHSVNDDGHSDCSIHGNKVGSNSHSMSSTSSLRNRGGKNCTVM